MHSIWFGGAQHHRRFELSRAPVQAAVLVVVVFVVRLCLPYESSDSVLVYEKLIYALTHQENWGKQALVGAVEYPPLVTFVLLPIQAVVRHGYMELVVTVAQIWTFVYLVRHVKSQRYGHKWFCAVTLFLPFVVTRGFVLDPFWICLLPMMIIYVHLLRWERHESLRDLVMITVGCGILGLAGVVGLLTALAVLVTVWCHGNRASIRGEGMLVFLLAPLVYVLALYPLFNWLIMGDPLFFLRRFIGHMLGGSGGGHWWLLGLSVILVVVHRRLRWGLHWHLACNLFVAGLLCHVLVSHSGYFVGGQYLLWSMALLSLLDLVMSRVRQQVGKDKCPRLGIRVAVAMLLILGVYLRGYVSEHEQFVAAPPPAEEILNVVDTHWQDSRIVLLDVRTAAIYAGTATNRFLAQLDYYETVMRAHANEEQLHLLLAPRNGRFYPDDNSVQTDIHRKGRQWLMLEKQWPNGWQLWRCIRPRSD